MFKDLSSSMFISSFYVKNLICFFFRILYIFFLVICIIVLVGFLKIKYFLKILIHFFVQRFFHLYYF